MVSQYYNLPVDITSVPTYGTIKKLIENHIFTQTMAQRNSTLDLL